MPHIELTFATISVVAILLLVACAAGAFFYYRRTIPPLSTSNRLTLAGLRGSGLFLTALLVLEPMARITQTTVEPPLVAVLIDNSNSMQLRDNSGDRAAMLRNAVRGVEATALPAEGKQEFYFFGRTLRSVDGSWEDSLELDEDATDISGALRQFLELKEQKSFRAAVLLSDGAYNMGENPLYAASGSGLPIFTVGIGDSSQPKDILLTKVLTNDLVYANSLVPVDVTVRAAGFPGQEIDVFLEQGGTVLDRKRVRIEEVTRDYKVELSYTAEGEGLKKFIVRIPEVSGELTSVNNRMSFTTRILKGKVNVLILAGGPSPDLSIVKQTLAEQERFEVLSRTQRIPSGYYEAGLSRDMLDSADCLLLIDFPTRSTNESDLAMLRSAMVEKRKPILFIAGRNLDQPKLSTLSPMLPVSPVTFSNTEQLVSIEPTYAQRAHPLLNIGSGGFDAWKRLPPVFRTRSTFKAKTEATVLAYGSSQGVRLDVPIIALRNVNKQRSISVLAHGIWRWRLMGQGDEATQDLFAEFLSACVRWLSNPEEDRQFRVTTTRDSYLMGEPVQFIGQLYDALAQPVDDAEVSVKVTRGNQAFETSLTPIGSGRYEGVLEGLPDGEFSFTASATRDGTSLGEYQGVFSIGEVKLEFTDTRMNAGLLRQLAERTGGAFLMPDQIDSLGRALALDSAFTAREVHHHSDIELWNWAYVLAAVILLFSSEWFLRKRNGLV